ncbi:hypothetical protein C8E83_1966 [Frondihabitans australicus]|uniref:Uncharacterized protein n=1 Tax=Frondihabitans australicus TaxID=386892 RepID=A0A495II96_9MICO|nr:hypothetical protein C8E83_1966 [Frondihabitans australicus]
MNETPRPMKRRTRHISPSMLARDALDQAVHTTHATSQTVSDGVIR